MERIVASTVNAKTIALLMKSYRRYSEEDHDPLPQNPQIS